MLFCYVPFFLSLRGLIVKFNNRTMNDDFIKTFCLKDFYDERHNMPEGSYLTEDFVLIMMGCSDLISSCFSFTRAVM